jgi:hypothetical protein
MKSRPVGAELFHAVGRTDRHDDDNIAIRNFGKHLKVLFQVKTPSKPTEKTSGISVNTSIRAKNLAL